MTQAEKILLSLPIVHDWVSYNGEVYYMTINYDRTVKARKPMIDLHYCATKALNGIVEKTVQWDKKKFKPCKQTTTWNQGNGQI